MAKENLIIELEAKNRASKELKAVSKDVKRMQGDHETATDTIKRNNNSLMGSMRKLGGVIAGAFVVRQAVVFGKELYELGTQMDLLDKKARTVFGNQIEYVEEFAEKNAAAMGLTKREYIDASAKIQDLLIPMEFARDEAAKMSTNLVDLSGALAEWSGGQRDAAEVSDILSKAMLGEREQLKSLGIAISAKEVDERAGIIVTERGIKASEQQAKAMATLELVYEKSTDAQEAFKNGGDSLYRRQVELKATLKDTKETLAVALLPTFQETTTAVLENVQAVLQDEETMNNLTMTMEGLGEVLEFVTDGVFGFTKAIGESMGYVADFIANAQQANKASNQLLGLTNSTSANVDYLTPEAKQRAQSLGIEYRAEGGPVSKGRPYVVGERGAELFVPDRNGSIIPNEGMKQTVNLNFQRVEIRSDMDIRNFADKLVSEIQRSRNNFSLGANH